MRHLFSFYLFILFTIIGHSQPFELDTKLIEINYGYSSNPKDFFIFKDKLFFRSIHSGLDTYSITNFDGTDVEFMRNHQGELIYSQSPIVGNELMYFIGGLSPYTGDSHLWVSDGTANSAQLIITPLLPTLTAIMNDKLFFKNSSELWISNGTSQGSFQLTNIITENHYFPNFNSFTTCEGKMFFLATDEIHGEELWVSDGTIDGTHMVKDIRTGNKSSDIRNLFCFNQHIYFAANDGMNGSQIWKSDGTTDGTSLLKKLGEGNYNAINKNNRVIEFNENFYFFANNGLGTQLWKSDGTTDGTFLFKEVNGFHSPNYQGGNIIYGTATDSYFVFIAYDYDSSSNQYIEKLWKSDGTIEGTTNLKDLHPTLSFSTNNFNHIHDKVYFSTYNNTHYPPRRELWVTDGTTTNTKLITDEFRDYIDFEGADENVFLKAQVEYDDWKVLRIDAENNSSIFLENIINAERGFKVFNDEIYFSFDYDYFKNFHPNGGELWKSDFSGENPTLDKDINLSAPSYPRNFAEVNGKTIFSGQDSSTSGLFITDGTLEGTEFIKKIGIKSTDTGKTQFFKVGNDYYFRGESHYPDFPPYTFHLYKTDGTTDGTALVSDKIHMADEHSSINKDIFEELNGKLYFLTKNENTSSTTHNELWVSDGTETGTLKVYDFPNDPSKRTKISSMKKFGNYIYFTTHTLNDSKQKRGIWRTDGTNLGTEQILDLTNYEDWQLNPVPYILGEVNGKLIFYTHSRISNANWNNKMDLYYLDDSDHQLKLYYSATTNILADKFPIVHQNNIFIPAIEYSNHNDSNFQIIKTDGTTEGTTAFFKLPPFLYPSRFASCGSFLYFDLHHELWRTDGTLNGTIQLKELDIDMKFEKIVCHKDNLYFSSVNYNDYIPDAEFIFGITNGQPNEVHQIKLNGFENTKYKKIHDLHSDGDILYLSIQDLIHGQELYVSNADFTLNTEEINENFTKESSNVLIYPNPTSSEITIVSNDHSNIQQIQLYDLTGKLLEVGIYNSNEVKLNIKKYSSGTYFIKVNTNKNTVTKKVIVK